MPELRRHLILLLLAILLVVGTALLYAPAARNGFVNYDDPDYVTRNLEVQHGLTWHGAVWAFGTHNPAANWHPLTWMSHMIDVSWYGLSPFGHHLTNIVLHCLGVLLLFLFLERATGLPVRSAAVAGLFALHPLNVESVAWVAERKAVLCMVFLALTLWSYAWYTKKPGIARYVLVAVVFALALMSKAMAITVPFILVSLDYWPLNRIPALRPRTTSPAEASAKLSSFVSVLRTGIVEKLPLFAMSAAAGWITWHIHQSEGALTGAMPLTWRLKNAVYSYLAYLSKAFWPTNLAVFYPHPENSLPLWKVLIAALSIVAITVAVWHFRERRYLLVGWLWFLGALVPMGGLVQSGRQGMADRYLYISLLGLLIAFVWLLADAAQQVQIRPALAATCFAVLAAPYGYVTHRQIGYWRDSYTLFAHALAVTQNNGVAENNFGVALMELGQLQLAAPHLAAAVRLTPDLTPAHYNLGVVLQNQNQLDAAAQQYKFVIANSRDAFEQTRAHNNLGVLYLTTNNLSAALGELNAAIALDPTEQNSYIGRGIVEFRSSNLDSAIADFSRAAQIAPSAAADFHLGRALETKGDFPQAELAYAAALRLNPGWAEVRVRLDALRNKPLVSRQESAGAK
jgi:tetratricopeptide (TPR) repeat protein